MEHNRVRYRVVQIANPTGWKWSVELAAGRQKTGVAHSRQSAILGAVHVIDKLLGIEHVENLGRAMQGGRLRTVCTQAGNALSPVPPRYLQPRGPVSKASLVP
jgi:hypothetical protein